MRRRARLLWPLGALGLLGCAAPRPAQVTRAPAAVVAPAPGDPLAAPDTDASEDVALARKKGLQRLFAFEPYGEAALRRARAEGRFLLLHGAAEWCHWCHVMEATTYTDPEVGAILRDRFVVMRVDIDERPDIAARYEAWGWPATVIFSPEAEELGKLKGFVPRERMLEVLRGLGGPGAAGAAAGPGLAERLGELPAPAAALGWIGARAAVDLDDRYDEEAGGWGGPKKAPLGPNVEFELRRHAHGDPGALRRARQTLAAQRALLDPVWGGLYQYSTGGDWQHPHFEKLLPVQTEALEAYAAAFAATRDPTLRRDAAAVARYLDAFLSSPAGAFLVSQDADLGGHQGADAGAAAAGPAGAAGTAAAGGASGPARFVDGHVYYARDDAGRRALGVPRIDAHVYARESGLGIAALVALHAATGEAAHLARARRAADLMLRAHVGADGAVHREAPAGEGGPPKVRYLVDAAALGRGLALLGEATREPRYLGAAGRIAAAMLRDFGEAGEAAPPRGPGRPRRADDARLFVSTRDPAASGVFARRERPLAHNALAARFLCALGRATGDPGYRRRAARILAAAATPRGIADEGRMIGGLLLALDEAGLFPW